MVPSELCKVREATGDAGSRTSAVAVCMVGLGACGTKEVSHVDGKVFICKCPLKKKKKALDGEIEKVFTWDFPSLSNSAMWE